MPTNGTVVTIYTVQTVRQKMITVVVLMPAKVTGTTSTPWLMWKPVGGPSPQTANTTNQSADGRNMIGPKIIRLIQEIRILSNMAKINGAISAKKTVMRTKAIPTIPLMTRKIGMTGPSIPTKGVIEIAMANLKAKAKVGVKTMTLLPTGTEIVTNHRSTDQLGLEMKTVIIAGITAKLRDMQITITSD
jgi:hypothetical protein